MKKIALLLLFSLFSISCVSGGIKQNPDFPCDIDIIIKLDNVPEGAFGVSNIYDVKVSLDKDKTLLSYFIEDRVPDWVRSIIVSELNKIDYSNLFPCDSGVYTVHFKIRYKGSDKINNKIMKQELGYNSASKKSKS